VPHLTLKQVSGFFHAPDKRVQKLAHTAAQAIEQRDEALKQLRDAQEKLAAVELERQPILILADHKGGITVKAAQYQSVKIIPVHESDSGDPNYENIDARLRTPMSHERLWDCKTIAIGHTGLDRYRRFWGESLLLSVKQVEP
jgi:hypothetical protein